MSFHYADATNIGRVVPVPLGVNLPEFAKMIENQKRAAETAARRPYEAMADGIYTPRSSREPFVDPGVA